MKTTTLTFATLALLSAGFLLPHDAIADHRSKDRSTRHAADSNQKSATRMPAPGQANRQPNRHFPPNYYLNRPMGSATPTPRGFYRDNLSYNPPTDAEGHGHGRGHHGGQIYLPQPRYVVVPPLFPEDDPLEFGGVRGPDEAVEPDELGSRTQPVVIEADNLYMVPPGRERYDESYAREPEVPVRNPNTALSHHGRVPTQAPADERPEPPAPTTPQEVTLRIEPADAVVWLDDEELGLAGELLELVHLEPGVYLLEVEHDDLEPQRLFFGVVDQPVDVRVDLEADEPRRRYRVR